MQWHSQAETAMPNYRFMLIVMTSLSAALLGACGTGGYSRSEDSGGDYSDVADPDWYADRADAMSCWAKAVRSGYFPGDAYDSYRANCGER